MAEQVIKEFRKGFPRNLTRDISIQRQTTKLKEEASILLEAIRSLGKLKEEPLLDVGVIESAVRIGLLDAPDLKGNDIAKGKISTAIIDGACVSVDPHTGKPLPEKERINRIMAGYNG
jgi:hypothetical protein